MPGVPLLLVPRRRVLAAKMLFGSTPCPIGYGTKPDLVAGSKGDPTVAIWGTFSPFCCINFRVSEAVLGRMNLPF